MNIVWALSVRLLMDAAIHLKYVLVDSSHLQNSIGGFCPPSNRLKEPVLELRHLPPDTPFRLAITPYTYWGVGDTMSKDLRSPGKGELSYSNNAMCVI